MRIANLRNRAVLLHDGRALDIETASGGLFSSDPQAVYTRWQEFQQWAGSADYAAAEPFDVQELGAPVPAPAQIFAIGLNYTDHADEAELPYPEDLVVFTKFRSALAGPHATVELPSDDVDYETELVVVMGQQVHRATEEEAWNAVAGLCVGQDYSERTVQRRGPVPQFSLGKSYPNFAPFGPAVTTVDELTDPDALSISAVLEGPGTEGKGDGGWMVQDGNTRDMIFSVPKTIANLSQVVTLYPGDLIFTGTPAGVGAPRGVLMRAGNVLTSTVEGIGSIRNEFV
ncbi:2-keto-4-pentenoate hydratase/2-oxohepta-3-ene-1,7-dioic acid hydratase in catechol pathway [Arthrobacter sp. SLBN-100]|uniref:fumarylacetoacetate hydrolase family protein n=1 Tax=Arthrobacter sp. SLBN-100 TaxID=2768450 RepID=UPI001151EDE8|nr:fumarylacetoacetate hydrolase family protein [Arthrobacter sp. SLBN-100]TQJ62067.1 2-keto-4-pentenoate hydratase/2-oxohepta-3-ene-1,7-dioic acid hydratase in catechol pathway [Arthrobacter sp. SLBN-100]TQJ62092.1 2-keto-4-pentenoate hydratase/2-oxohepta-3-ene-1,7-dioic acid hydratase in catechol pathway [Arthrobacter sp. SLBN-100]